MPGDFPDRAALGEIQARRLCALLAELVPRNRFYTEKFARAGLNAQTIRGLDDLPRLPLTTKNELLADQEDHPPYGSNLTYPLEAYCRLFQTSGTTSGRPLRWLDTRDSFEWMLGCWRQIFAIIGIGPRDRLFFPFSFGPFLGFWTAFETASRLGIWCLPGGGMSSVARLRHLLENSATVLFCTPTYGLHLLEVARQEGLDLASSSVRALVVAGEPGGSIPSVRELLERGWGARVFDHSGMTEVGPLGIECLDNPAGLHLLETECLVEVLDPATLQPVPPGTAGELVLTNLGRLGSPLLRYRTGDLVRVDPQPCPCGRALVRLAGGIIGRVDDMIQVRGNNLHPSALEAIIRRFPGVAEFRLWVDRSSPLASVRIEIEPAPGVQPEIARQIERAIRDELLFRAEVQAVAPGALPRYEMKARRVLQERTMEAG